MNNLNSQRFNLLPHREMAERFARQLLLRQVIVLGAVAILCAALGTFYLQLRLGQAVAMNATLNMEIGELIPKYRQSTQMQQHYGQLLQRQQLIESLDARRSTSVLLLADVADALPQEIYLTKLSENGSLFSVEGRAADSSAIARFMEKLSQSAYLADVVLHEIRSQEPDTAAPFQFSIGGAVRLINQTNIQPGAVEVSR